MIHWIQPTSATCQSSKAVSSWFIENVFLVNQTKTKAEIFLSQLTDVHVARVDCLEQRLTQRRCQSFDKHVIVNVTRSCHFHICALRPIPAQPLLTLHTAKAISHGQQTRLLQHCTAGNVTSRLQRVQNVLVHAHLGLLVQQTCFTARRYAKRGICRCRVSVCLCVCHTPVLYQNG